MRLAADIDVVVGGGGVAGTAAAAALQQAGYRVLLVEPGVHEERRLCGEVFHPPGVEGLADLGLTDTLTRDPAVMLRGFSISFGGEGNECIGLPYDIVPAHRMSGLSLDHGLIRERLLTAVSALPNVTVMRHARVIGIDQSGPSRLRVHVANDKADLTYLCRLLVAADGAPSRLARLAGIGIYSRRISTMFGYRITADHLARNDYGHVFLGAVTPILAYPIGAGEARILFDIPHRDGVRPSGADCMSMCSILPPSLRQEVENVIATQPHMSASTQVTSAERSVAGRVVLVGDAAGSCHPLTASGMTMCISDALLLRNVLAGRPDNVEQALRLYELRRRQPQTTRLALAESLRNAFCATSPTLRVVRRGVLSHWRASDRGRSATMALLTTADGRPLSLFRQFALAAMRGLWAHLQNPTQTGDGWAATPRVVLGLVAALISQMRLMVAGVANSALKRW